MAPGMSCIAIPPLCILVVGECGDGKSTVINNLIGRQDADTGRDPRGITKRIVLYKVTGLLEGREVWLYDTPGIGDMDVNATMLIGMIEEQIAAGETLDGVVVTSPVTDGRVKLGAQVVQTLVDQGFVSKDKWQHVILNGTKMDRAEPEDEEFFRSKLRDQFFQGAKPGEGLMSMTSKADVSQLVQAFKELPAAKVQYTKPDVQVMSQALAGKMGIDEGIFQEELTTARAALDDERRLKKEAEDRERQAHLDHTAALERERKAALDREQDNSRRLEESLKRQAQMERDAAVATEQEKAKSLQAKLKAKELEARPIEGLTDWARKAGNCTKSELWEMQEKSGFDGWPCYAWCTRSSFKYSTGWHEKTHSCSDGEVTLFAKPCGGPSYLEFGYGGGGWRTCKDVKSTDDAGNIRLSCG